MKALLTFLSFILCGNIFSQNGDCLKAINICTKDSFSVQFSSGTVKNEVTTINAVCFSNGIIAEQDIESQSVWIKWRVAESGTLAFTITPNDLNDDVDFVVFKIEDNNCNNKKLVRCMATGTTSGGCSLLGATGLKTGEVDTTERSGCTTSQNNFLAPLSMQANERYVLFINNFTNTANSKAKITWSGTATFGCETSLTQDSYIENLVTIFPNPANNDITIKSENVIDKVFIFNNLGQIIMNKNYAFSAINTLTLPLTNVQNGQYNIKIETQEGHVIYKKLIVAK